MNPIDLHRCARALAVTIALLVFLAAGAPRNPRSTEPPPSGAKKSPASPPSLCAPMTGEVIPAEKVLADLRDGKSVSLQGKTIEGSLDMDSVYPVADSRRTSWRVVQGGLKLQSCRITGNVALRHCVFTQDIVLTCSEVLGDVDLSDSEIRGSVKADRARIASDVRLVNTTLEGDLALTGAVLQGSFDFSGSRLHRVFLTGMEVSRVTADHAILQTLDLVASKVAGSMRLSDVLVLDSIAARDATFSRGLVLDAVRAGTIQLGWTSVSGEVNLANVEVMVDFVLPHIFDGPAILTDIVVGRNLIMEGGQLQDVSIERLKVRGFTNLPAGRFEGRVVIKDANFGTTFKANETVFAAEVEFRNVFFPGDDPFAGVSFVRKPTLIDTKLLHDPTAKGEAAKLDDDDTPDDEEP